MRVVFHLFLRKEGRCLLGRIKEFLNWTAPLRQGCKITLALKSRGPRCNVESLKTAEVVCYEENETYANAWVDMEELTEDLRDGSIEVTGWKEISDPEPD